MKIQQALISIGIALFANVCLAQTFSIDWHTIDGGGGTSTGGVFAVSGTAGQPDANSQALTGGTFSLTGGFWSIMAGPTSNLPITISMEQQSTGIRIFWLLPSTGFLLEQSSTVTGIWSQVIGPYATNATTISINLPAPTGNNFFRLHRP